MAHIEDAAHIIQDAGGIIVGRTRFQKLAYLLEATGLGAGFSFDYRRFGPYSDDLAICARDAALLGLLNEQEMPAGWGGKYSIFTSENGPREDIPESRIAISRIANAADPIELELAATAVFLAARGYASPWDEVSRRKPEKSEAGRLARAKALYERLRAVNTPQPLPGL